MVYPRLKPKNFATFDNLPYFDESGFHDRKEELEFLQKLVISGQAKTINVSGYAGVGKTTIVLKLAHLLKEQGFFQTIVWVTAKRENLVVVGNGHTGGRFDLRDVKEKMQFEGIWANDLDHVFLALSGAIKALDSSPKPDYGALRLLDKLFDNLQHLLRTNQVKTIRFDKPEVIQLVDSVLNFFRWTLSLSLLEKDYNEFYLTAQLRERPTLVVIDDLDEWPSERWGSVVRFIENSPPLSRVIITSRKKLLVQNISGLIAVEIQPYKEKTSLAFIDTLNLGNQLHLSQSEKAKIVEYAKGTPFVIELVVDILKNRRTSDKATLNNILDELSDNSDLTNYLFDNLYKNVSKKAQELFVIIACLDTFSKDSATLGSVKKLSGIKDDGFLLRHLQELEFASLIDFHTNKKKINPNQEIVLTELARMYAMSANVERRQFYLEKIRRQARKTDLKKET